MNDVQHDVLRVLESANSPLEPLQIVYKLNHIRACEGRKSLAPQGLYPHLEQLVAEGRLERKAAGYPPERGGVRTFYYYITTTGSTALKEEKQEEGCH